MSYDQPTFDATALLEAGESPFRCEFSLRERARYWQRDAEADGPVGAIVPERLVAAPELLDTITDRAVRAGAIIARELAGSRSRRLLSAP